MTPKQLADIHAHAFPLAPWSEKTFTELLSRKTVQLWSEQKGFLIASVIPPEAEILTLAVHPDHQRKGIAKRLVKTLCQSCETAFLDVAADNIAARTLYAGCDFQETGRRTSYYKRAGCTPVDAVLMTWTREPNASDKAPRIG